MPCKPVSTLRASDDLRLQVWGVLLGKGHPFIHVA
jgi:hypothetical protein